ncbi:PREDICTED: uncharacterized protein LOC109470354 [Branchiostoma belcheri]|uniref:Uncharacterized protein LOC109470354 n=1 Tax=Branchiostoma belcheri TaxID=7741 RepID=A0A6P4YK95_BRABE|nr:PREDICTED: uncharacterized protein LOC109470354 [Branchiostoma belcheri]
MDQRQRDQANTTQLLGRGRPLGNNNMSNSADGTNVTVMNPKRLDDIEVLETCDDSRPGSVVPTWSSTVSSSGYYSPTPDLEHEFLRSICVRQASMEKRLENIEAQGARQEQSQAALERSTRETNTLVKQLLDNHDNKAHVDRTFCDTLCQRLEKLENTISRCVQPSKLQEIRDDIHTICEKLKKTPTDGNWKELVQSLELEAEHLNLEVTILKVEGILHDLRRKLQASPSLSPSRGQTPLTSPEEVDSVLQKLKEVKISEGRIKNSAEIEGNGNHSFLCGNHATFNFPRDQVEGALGQQLSDVVLQPGRLPGRCQSKGGTAMTILIQVHSK